MFLTVKEASDLTGKSATTIYRLCNKRKNSLYIKKEDNKFFIDKEFLLATYPQEEKRIIEIIENGSKEMGEPVFLEIEPKLTETIVVPTNAENTIEPVIEVASVDSMNDAENEYISALKTLSFVGDDNVVINKSTDSTGHLETIDLPFYRKKTFWEGIIGLSLVVLVLVSLLVLFYLNVN